MEPILGTDLSEPALARARGGRYSEFETQRGLDDECLHRHFSAVGRDWQIDASIRSLTTFRRANLLNLSDDLGRFHIIFCRNVSTYFDLATRKRLFRQLAHLLLPGGALVLGATETVVGVSELSLCRDHGYPFHEIAGS
jgi:chemotaxis protein methyltransferase CheR